MVDGLMSPSRPVKSRKKARAKSQKSTCGCSAVKSMPASGAVSLTAKCTCDDGPEAIDKTQVRGRTIRATARSWPLPEISGSSLRHRFTMGIAAVSGRDPHWSLISHEALGRVTRAGQKRPVAALELAVLPQVSAVRRQRSGITLAANAELHPPSFNHRNDVRACVPSMLCMGQGSHGRECLLFSYWSSPWNSYFPPSQLKNFHWTDKIAGCQLDEWTEAKSAPPRATAP